MPALRGILKRRPAESGERGHLTPAYRPLRYARGNFPVAEAFAERSMSLPMHPHLSSAQTEYVVEQLAKAVE
jgi:dTDP-4-amino-4,6-dideoxygalactose transaminase